MGTLSGYLTGADRYNLARGAGFNASDAVTMAAISFLECGNCDMSSVNKTGDSSLWQINAVHGYSVAWLADPVNSAAAAYSVWKSQGFDGWCTYPGGCGGASKTTPAQWAAAVAHVTADLAQYGVGNPITAPSGTSSSGATGQGDVSGGQDSGSGQSGGGTTSGTSGTSSTSGTGVQLGSLTTPLGSTAINIPTGLVLGVIGFVVLLIGVVMLAGPGLTQVATSANPGKMAIRAAGSTVGKLP